MNRKKPAGRQDQSVRKKMDWKALEIVHPEAAGIDVGGSEHWVAMSPERDTEPVRRFGCFTDGSAGDGADGWSKKGVRSVAMQSTGVYWMPVFEILEQHGLEVFLVNARHTKNVPGRKSDIQECQWLLKLHAFGLLNNSFQPTDEVRVARTLWRQRGDLVAEAGSAIQRMQKVLIEMNVQLSNVLSDLSGVSGMKIIGAILKGERDPWTLAAMVEPEVKASPAGDSPQPRRELAGGTAVRAEAARWSFIGFIRRRSPTAMSGCANIWSRSGSKVDLAVQPIGPKPKGKEGQQATLRSSICARSCIALPESTGHRSTASTC